MILPNDKIYADFREHPENGIYFFLLKSYIYAVFCEPFKIGIDFRGFGCTQGQVYTGTGTVYILFL